MDMAQRIATEICENEFIRGIILKLYEGGALTEEEAALLTTEEGASKVSYYLYYLYYWLNYTYG